MSSYVVHGSVPKLKFNGENWLIFECRFRVDMEAKGIWGHFDGSSKRPFVRDSSESQSAIADATAVVVRTMSDDIVCYEF